MLKGLFKNLLTELLARQIGDFANAPAFLNENRNVEQGFEVVVGIGANVGVGPFGHDNFVALLPNTERVGLNAREVLQIFDAVRRLHSGFNP